MSWSYRQSSLSLAAKVKGLAGEEQAHDEAKEAQDGAEDFDDQDLDESVMVVVSVSLYNPVSSLKPRIGQRGGHQRWEHTG